MLGTYLRDEAPGVTTSAAVGVEGDTALLGTTLCAGLSGSATCSSSKRRFLELEEACLSGELGTVFGSGLEGAPKALATSPKKAIYCFSTCKLNQKMSSCSVVHKRTPTVTTSRLRVDSHAQFALLGVPFRPVDLVYSSRERTVQTSNTSRKAAPAYASNGHRRHLPTVPWDDALHALIALSLQSARNKR